MELVSPLSCPRAVFQTLHSFFCLERSKVRMEWMKPKWISQRGKDKNASGFWYTVWRVQVRRKEEGHSNRETQEGYKCVSFVEHHTLEGGGTRSNMDLCARPPNVTSGDFLVFLRRMKSNWPAFNHAETNCPSMSCPVLFPTGRFVQLHHPGEGTGEERVWGFKLSAPVAR